MKWLRLTMLFSPAGFVVLAALIAGAYHVCHGLGWREYTCVLSGTPPVGDSSDLTWLRAGIYVVFYFAYVLVVPILLIAAAVVLLMQRAMNSAPGADMRLRAARPTAGAGSAPRR